MTPPRGDVVSDCDARATSDSIGVARAPSGLLKFLGPALLVSVGYMDPGNWATDLEGGAHFGYQLIWVLLASNLLALVLQNLCARLGIVAGFDLATGCRREFSRPLSVALWLLAELAIVACDLAEVLGSAVALELLFGLPMLWGALVTSIDVLLILMLQRRGMRRLEAAVLVMLLTVGACMLVELWLARPSLAGIASGLRPKLGLESLYAAIGILGATVMPHNLYLHSALVPKVQGSARVQALRRSFWSTALALNLALLVNGAILIVAAAVFWQRGVAIQDLRDAHSLLTPLLGSGLASLLFAVGLLCAGQSATVSGTLAGQIVMEGFIRIRLPAVARRALTRAMAIVPAVGVLAFVGDGGLMSLLLGSQIVLSLQLPFAIVPLLRLTNSSAIMGSHANGAAVRWFGAGSAALIVAANVALVARTVAQWWEPWPWLASLLASVSFASLVLLLRVASVRLRSGRSASASAQRSAEYCPAS